MAIKMKRNESKEAVCTSCGEGQSEVLDIFSIKVGSITLEVVYGHPSIENPQGRMFGKWPGERTSRYEDHPKKEKSRRK